jgi:thioesterase domain-containing protein
MPEQANDMQRERIIQIETQCRELEAENKKLKQLLFRLAIAESIYRMTHELHGEGREKTARAWDRMKKAGVDASEFLAFGEVNL